MAKIKQTFICDACGYETYKWMGKCPRCAAWDTIKEIKLEQEGEKRQDRKFAVTLGDEDVEEERLLLDMVEMDRVLGGGLTKGSSILLGGDPGIGKTTLCFEIAARVVEMGFEVLYVSGEESLRQLAGRKKRLGLAGSFSILVTSNLGDIMDAIQEKTYALVVIDSIQSIYNTKLPFLPGSMSQIRDVSSRLIRELKSREATHIFVGHVTKEGTIAGPKILEHMVDTVLYFEGDKMLPYRMLRAIKNRFGPVDEIGLFQMTREGLVSAEPSLFFISEREEASSGTTLFPYITGSRPLLIEVQALTPKTVFPIPKKLSVGYDVNRLFILTAVMEKTLGLPFSDRDVYVNVTGGIKVNEPGVDLAVAAAILSSYKNLSWRDTAFFGEIGLTGEVRRVVNMELRVKECERLKVKKVLCPRGLDKSTGVELLPTRNIRELADYLSQVG